MSRIKGKAQPESCRPTASVVGIDVSKGWLNVFVHPHWERFRVDNDPAGIRRLRKRCLTVLPELVVMEATGRYHRIAHACLHEAGLPVVVVNPYRSRRFADVLRRLTVLAQDFDPGGAASAIRVLQDVDRRAVLCQPDSRGGNGEARGAGDHGAAGEGHGYFLSGRRG